MPTTVKKPGPLELEFPSGLVPDEVSRRKPTTDSVRLLAQARKEEMEQLLARMPERLPRPAMFILPPSEEERINALQKQVDYLNNAVLFLTRRDIGTHELVVEDVHTRPTETECKQWTTEQIAAEAAEMHQLIADIVKVGGDLQLRCVELVEQGYILRKRDE